LTQKASKTPEILRENPKLGKTMGHKKRERERERERENPLVSEFTVDL